MSAATPDPRQWREAERWLKRADEDVRAAEALLAVAPPIVASAAFHCQQAVEKMAKATLIAARIAPPRAHDILDLAREISPVYPELAAAVAALKGVTEWYISARYPDVTVGTDPTPVEVRDALARIRDLRVRIADLKPGVPSP